MNLVSAKINAIIFDLDGLIVDTEPLHQKAFNLLLARHGIPYEIGVEEYGRDYVGLPVREDCQRAIANYALPLDVDTAFAERQAIYLDLIAGIDAQVRRIGDQVKVDRLAFRERGVNIKW